MTTLISLPRSRVRGKSAASNTRRLLAWGISFFPRRCTWNLAPGSNIGYHVCGGSVIDRWILGEMILSWVSLLMKVRTKISLFFPLKRGLSHRCIYNIILPNHRSPKAPQEATHVILLILCLKTLSVRAQPTMDLPRTTELVWHSQTGVQTLQLDLDHILDLPLSSWVTLTKSCNFFVLQFYHLLKRDNSRFYFIGLLWGLNECIYITGLESAWYIEKVKCLLWWWWRWQGKWREWWWRWSRACHLVTQVDLCQREISMTRIISCDRSRGRDKSIFWAGSESAI